MKRTARRITAKKAARGFTAIEVMLSLTVLAIGTAGVIAMQTTAIDGNYDARRLDVANGILREWTERLRRDSMMWTLPNTRNPLVAGDNRVANATLLAIVDPDPTNASWRLPIAREGDPVPLMPQFDLLGRDVTVAATPVVFCTQVRLSWLVTNDLIRADVRVFWPRGTGSMGGDCTNDPPAGWELLPATIAKYHFVYGVTAIRRNPSP
ncbi:MAG: prepilin-type N-terminal cleavage/methylation domain-containing protein [Polyangiaceae bacterium]